jgi:hypothetical protein
MYTSASLVDEVPEAIQADGVREKQYTSHVITE